MRIFFFFLHRPNAPSDHSSILAFINHQQITSVLFGGSHTQSWQIFSRFFFFFLVASLKGCCRLFSKDEHKKSSSSNNAGKMAKGCLLKQMQESKFQSWRVMDISQRKITQSNTTACWAFLMNTTQSKCNNNQGRYFRYGVYDPQSRCSFIFAVLFRLQTAC